MFDTALYHPLRIVLYSSKRPHLNDVTYESGENCCLIGSLFSWVFADIYMFILYIYMKWKWRESRVCVCL